MNIYNRMANLLEYKTPLVFECNYKKPSVNTLNEHILEFDIDNDTKICSHCFYDSEKVNTLEHILNSKIKQKKNKSFSSKRQIKKNKSYRK